MTAVKLETNFASFPKVDHDGATALRFDFLDDCLKLSQLNLVPKHLAVGFPHHCAGAMILIHPAKGQH